MDSNYFEGASPIGAARLLNLTAEISSAYFSNNSVPTAEVANVIGTIHSSLQSLNTAKVELLERPMPRLPIKKTVTPDFLISLEDGGRYKSLKRHLTKRGMTPSQYKEKWGLPSDYPMVAPTYAARRSELAKSIGLGRKRAEQGPAEAKAQVGAEPRAKRGRPRKVSTSGD